MKRGRGRPRKGKTVPISVRFPEKLANALRAKAARERRDISTTLIMIAEAALAAENSAGAVGA